MSIDLIYSNLVHDVMDNGQLCSDRTGVGTRSVFGRQIRYAANNPFPLLTTKTIYTKSIIHELLWFISGSSNIRYLLDNDVHIWDEWSPAYKRGIDLRKADHCELPDSDLELNRVYGAQWRDWRTNTHEPNVDQLSKVINDLKTNPSSRRHIVSAWNVAEVDKMGLPPCHCFFQFYVRHNKFLNCHMYQRSADLALGVPFNIASYSLLLCMVAQVVGLEPGEVIHSFGDLHIYNNHIDGLSEQLSRLPNYLPGYEDGPILKLNPHIKDIDDFRFEDINIEGYHPHKPIKFEIAV